MSDDLKNSVEFNTRTNGEGSGLAWLGLVRFRAGIKNQVRRDWDSSGVEWSTELSVEWSGAEMMNVVCVYLVSRMRIFLHLYKALPHRNAVPGVNAGLDQSDYNVIL